MVDYAIKKEKGNQEELELTYLITSVIRAH